MDVPLGEVVYFDAITTNPSTGAAADADSTPTFEVFEESTDTDIGVGGNLTKRTSKTGDYRGSFTASSGNGFEAGKWYSVIASATVNSVAGKSRVMMFRAVAAENAAGVPASDAVRYAGQATTTNDIALKTTLAKTTHVTGFNDLDAAGVRTAVGLATANLDTQLADLPTNSELTTALNALNDLSAAEIRTALGMASADLDTQLDALATLIAGLNDLSAAEIRTALGLATANLDAQLADLPTVAEFNARTLPSADYFDSATDQVTPTTASKTGYSLSTAGNEAVAAEVDELLSTSHGDGSWEDAGGGGGGDATLAKQEEILAAIAALDVGGGDGSEPVTITVVDENGDEVTNANIAVFSGATLKARGTTEADGQPHDPLSINDGVGYRVYVTADGYQQNSELVTAGNYTLNVSGPTAKTIVLTANAPATHTDPALCIGHYVTWGANGKRESGVEVTATLKTWPDGSAGDAFDDGGWTLTSDDNAAIAFGSVSEGTGLFRGAVYLFTRGDSGRSWEVEIPDAGSVNLDPIAGSP